MLQTPSKFQQELARGREYEVAFSRWLQAERGFYTVPVFDLNRMGAPRIEGRQPDGTLESLVMPDILACKNGAWVWFEVKLKDHADWHRKTNTLVTGLPLRNWQHYLAVQKATRTPVWIVFVHLTEREVLAGDISVLSYHHIHHASTMDNGGTVFFTYSTLHRLMPLATLDTYKVDKS